MKEYIEREAVIKYLEKYADGYSYIETPTESAIADIKVIPAADVVEVDAVFEMLDYTLGDCPCNYSPTDEWLPEVCELQDECPDPKEKYGCWRQFIKHFRSRKMDGGVNDDDN